MQVIEVGVRDQNQIDRGKIGNAQAGTPETFQYEEPAREVRIDHYTLPAHLHKKAGVADEGDAEFAVCSQTRLMRLSTAGSDRRVTHQTPKLSGTFAEGRIAQGLLDHAATEPGETGEGFNFMILVMAAAVRVTTAMRPDLFTDY